MKKTIYIIIGLVILLGIVAGAYFLFHKSDAQKFKAEYEALNGTKNENRDVYWPVMDVDTNNPMKYITDVEAVQLLNKGTGMIYFGFDDCPWCRNLIPVLLDTAKKMKVETIYYLDLTEIRDTKKLDEENNLITIKEGSTAYYQLLDRLKNYLPDYELTDEKGNKYNTDEKRLLAPTLVFVKDGRIALYHMGTVDSHMETGNGYILLNEEQKQELSDLLIKGIQKLEDEDCTDDIDTQGC